MAAALLPQGTDVLIQYGALEGARDAQGHTAQAIKTLQQRARVRGHGRGAPAEGRR